MSTTPFESRITARRAELTRQRAERKDEDELPRSMTNREVRSYLADTIALDRRIANFEGAVAEHAACAGADADDLRWRDFLVSARKRLCDDRLQIKSPIRDRELKLRADALEWSIRYVDHGLGISTIGAIVTLETTPIGALMAAEGFAVSGAALRGPNGFRGSLPETEQRLKDHARRLAAAEAALDEVLLTDEERAARDAEADELRAARSSLRLKGNAEGTGLIARDADDNELPVSEMTALQRKAFERANAEYAVR